ncbi:unnamed protein product [Paramecium primaurelia]|uniref:Uncharacterized protein n=1 Tax=Paramecium primaurelia TaxID=5886 RepID=A0A8S1Q034_PARPR|nr:unnamed protein product [Paramecium primaurelia]
MSCIGQAQQQMSQKLIKTDGDDSDTPIPESDKDNLGQILNTEESKDLVYKIKYGYLIDPQKEINPTNHLLHQLEILHHQYLKIKINHKQLNNEIFYQINS